MGAWIPFAPTADVARTTGDPRASLAQRYASRADFLAQVRRSAEAVAHEGFLLAKDADAVVEQAALRWDRVVGTVRAGQ